MSLIEVNSRYQQGYTASVCGREPVFFLPLPASRGHRHSLSHSPFLCLWSQQHSIFKSVSDSKFCLPLPHLKGPCDYTGFTGLARIIYLQVGWLAILIPAAALVPFCHVTITHRFRRQWHGHLWRAIICPQGLGNAGCDPTKLSILEVPEHCYLSLELTRHENWNSKPPGFLEMASEKC